MEVIHLSHWVTEYIFFTVLPDGSTNLISSGHFYVLSVDFVGCLSKY